MDTEGRLKDGFIVRGTKENIIAPKEAKAYQDYMASLDTLLMLEEFRRLTSLVLDACILRHKYLCTKVDEIHNEQEELQQFISAMEDAQ